ncbi:MAG: hypothetical protein IKM45_01485 [Opitutales bacterium]|nr:hypothetical protein [Opitutales bacterium]
MLKKIFIALLCLVFTGTSAFAAFSAKTFAAAKKRNPKDGIIVYFYGPDWDVRSTKMLKTLWESSEIKNACGDASMLSVPVYQEPNEKQKKNAKAIREGMKVPHIFSYPAIVMFTEEGEKYYILQGDEIFEDKAEVAETIKAKLKLFRERKAILKKAERAKGVEKAKLYGDALLEGIEPPANALKIIKASDPKGETPYAKRLEFDVFKLLTDQTYKDPDKPDKVLIKPDAAVALVTKLAIEDETTYLPEQRQELLACCAAYLRRLDKTDSRIKMLHKKILEIDPDSIWADFVKDSEARWLGVEKKKDKKEKRRKRK